MVAITYNVYIDLNRDGDFGDANEDITSYVKRCSIQRGASKPFDTLARDTTIDLVLDNSSGVFVPKFAPPFPATVPATLYLRPNGRIKVDMTYNSTTVTLAIGKIAPDGIDVEPGSKGSREIRVRTTGVIRMLQDKQDVTIGLLQDKRTDELITDVIAAGDVYPVNFAGARLGIFGQSELDSVALAGDATDYLDLDTGATTVAYAGDQWGQTVSVYGMIRDVADAERGLVYERRDGKLAMRSRHFFLTDVANAADAAITGSHLQTGKPQDYRFAENVFNEVMVTGYPRAVASSRTTVARIPLAANTGIIVPPGRTGTYTLGYVNSTGTTIGAYDILCESGTDYQVDIWDSQSQSIIAGNPTVDVVVTEGAGNVTLELTNLETSVNAIFVPGSTDASAITVRGKAITTYDPFTATAIDPDSIQYAGRRPKRMDLKLLSDAEAITDTALFEVTRTRLGVGEMLAITLNAQKSATVAAWVRDLTIGSRITLTETQTNQTDLSYFIVGERHDILSPYEHYVTYTLRRTHEAFGVLGVTGYAELAGAAQAGIGDVTVITQGNVKPVLGY